MKNLLVLLTVIISFSPVVYAEESRYIFSPDGANFYVYGRGSESFIITQSRLASLKLDAQLAQLSSGKRIVNAADDPSGLAVAEKMNGLLNQLKQESINAEDMRNFHNFVEAAIAEDQLILQRMHRLLIQASSGMLNSDDRGLIQAEIDQLIAQINMNANFAQFNTVNVVPDLTAENLGLDPVNAVHNIYNSAGLVDEAMKKLTVKRVLSGVKSNILTFRIEGKSYQYLNLQRSESNISDLDMSEGISELVRNSILIKSRHGLIIRSK